MRVNVLRRFYLMLSAVTCALLCGCVTSWLFQHEEYGERVDSILMTEDGLKILVVTNKYHYIFDAPKIIADTLRSPIHPYVYASFYHPPREGKSSNRRHDFFVDSNNHVSGNYEIYLRSDSPSEMKKQAKHIGYEDAVYGTLQIRGELHGTRYLLDKNQQPSVAMQRLNKNYDLLIDAKQPKWKTMAKYPLTPVTIAIDGTLALAAVPLIPFTIFIAKAGAARL